MNKRLCFNKELPKIFDDDLNLLLHTNFITMISVNLFAVTKR